MKKKHIIGILFIIVILGIGYTYFVDKEARNLEENLKMYEKTDDVDDGVTKKIEIKITGDEAADDYIRAFAEARGYERREIADEVNLVDYEGQRIHQDALDDFIAMRTEMEREGMNLVLVSGYRSLERQRTIFLRKLGDEFTGAEIVAGEADELLNSILAKSSIPGYSKHHSGLAIDVGCDNYILDDSFLETDCYRWLAGFEDSAGPEFENAAKYNFFPSYPFGIETQGPDSEPWELIYTP